jgi:hypothetical protein
MLKFATSNGKGSKEVQVLCNWVMIGEKSMLNKMLMQRNQHDMACRGSGESRPKRRLHGYTRIQPQDEGKVKGYPGKKCRLYYVEGLARN